jgi:hypothetical protein
MYGTDTNGRAYIHVRIYKGHRVYGEVFTTHPVSILCRMCGLWWNINIINDEITMKKRQAPSPTTGT